MNHKNSNSQPLLDLRRAAVLTGIAPEDLQRLSRQANLGQPAPNGSAGEVVFTYDDLWRLCTLAARSD